jgi:hypothetical protein
MRASHMPKTGGHSWRFKTRFRRHAFGWKSQPAIARIQEALSEIKQVARLEPVLAAEGAIALLERISPALEHVDSSSGAIGSAVNSTIAELVPVIASAPADARTRTAWLDRLFEAHAADQIPYIERLAEYWGELCGSRELASEWADRLISVTHLAPSPGKSTRGYFHGTSVLERPLHGRALRRADRTRARRRLVVLQAVGCEGPGCTTARG